MNMPRRYHEAGTFPNRIKELRIGRELTGPQLARLLKISPTLLSYYETGRREPTADKLKKLSKFFMVPIRELFVSETGHIPQPKPPKQPGDRNFCTKCRSFYTSRWCPICYPATKQD
jgi:transcriptional regulator with XRE-family HTH domain